MVNLLEFAELYPDEESCVQHLEEARWHGDVRSIFTGGEVYRMKTRSLYKCKETGKQFSVRQGTIFEESRLPLRKWFMALYILNSLKKGVSSIQLGKVPRRDAKNRVVHGCNASGTRWSMRTTNPRWRVRWRSMRRTSAASTKGGKRGRGSENKTPVVGLAERGGHVHCQSVANVKTRTVGPIVRDNVKIGSTLHTDEFKIYPPIARQGYGHEVVKHGEKEYVRGKVHTNTVEGFWSHLKRGIKGIYIQVSQKHLNKYCKEYEFRYNTRQMSDFDRFCAWFDLCGGRLTYQSLIAA